MKEYHESISFTGNEKCRGAIPSTSAMKKKKKKKNVKNSVRGIFIKGRL